MIKWFFYSNFDYPKTKIPMLQWRVKELLIEKGYQYPHKWLLQCKVSSDAAQTMLHNKKEQLQLRNINNICEAAYCTPNDLLVWTPKEAGRFLPSHPLQALRARAIANINLKIKSLSPEQIIALDKVVDEMRK